MIRVWIIEAAIFAAPIFALIASRLGNKKIRPEKIVACGALVALPGFCFDFTSWACRSDTATLVLESLSYVVGIGLMFYLVALVNIRWIRWFFRTILSIPILVGLGLGTVGFLGLLFIVGDQTPETVRELTAGYALEVRLQGGAYTSTDYADVTIVRYLPVIPLKTAIWHKSYDSHQYVILHVPKVVLASNQRSATVSMERLDGGVEKETIELK